MRILLDNGVVSHSEFAQGVIKHTPVRWGSSEQVAPLHGFIRKASDKNAEHQRQKDALFTVGRLIREGRIKAYDYHEIHCERMRDKIGFRVCNALQGCEIRNCSSALERSRFRQTVNFRDSVAKGGKKDKRAGVNLGGANQIAFLTWLYSLRKEQIESLLKHAASIHLTEFEIESLRNIEWFQFLCRRSGSPENYPDVFHLWTAERNRLDAVLTLDKGLPNLVSRVRNERLKRIDIRTEVLRPLDMLQKFGIENPDPVPMEHGRFYYCHELMS